MACLQRRVKRGGYIQTQYHTVCQHNENETFRRERMYTQYMSAICIYNIMFMRVPVTRTTSPFIIVQN